jgi:hypothetical protein
MPAIKAANRKGVNLSPSVEIFQISSRQTLSANKIRSMWYNKSGLDAIKASNTETIVMMTAGRVFYGNDEYCSRGLCIKTESRNRRNARLNAVITVLREQELQSVLGMKDDELLADMYFESSRQSQLEALQRGVQILKK